jgi:nucleoside 2-deoxyribosyltransferase
MRVYLAGPDVFLPAADARAAALKAICARHGLLGVSPLDALDGEPAGWSALPEARRIALRNEAHMGGCAALIANLTPFRGPSADAGTVFEVGYMRGLGRPVFGWSNSGVRFTERTRAFLGDAATSGPDGTWRDGEGMLIEAFGLADNLMIEGAIFSSGGALFTAEVEDGLRWTDLTAFERCAAAAARQLAG